MKQAIAKRYKLSQMKQTINKWNKVFTFCVPFFKCMFIKLFMSLGKM
jgi:hypothetical protein